MRAQWRLFPALAAALCLLQCDPRDFGLFPAFLTRVSHSKDLSAVLPYAPGSKYFLYVLPAPPAVGSEIVYAVQVSPGGIRKTAMLDGVLTLLNSFTNGSVGGLHWAINQNTHLVGTCLINVMTPVAPIVIPITGSFPADCRDYPMAAFQGGSFGVFGPAAFNSVNGVTEFPCYSVSIDPYTPSVSIASSPTMIQIAAFGRVFTLENAGIVDSSACLVFRDCATAEGYIYSSTTLPGLIMPEELRPMGRIVPGTVTIDNYGRMIAEKLDGRIVRVSISGAEVDDDGAGTDLHDYVAAYGMNDAMYLFKPATGRLLKTLAWWRID